MDKIKFYFNRLGERLWIRPLIMSLVAVAGALVARGADYTQLGSLVPEIQADSVKTLLTVMSGSMLVIATFSVASMVAAYASASGSATPRSFSLVLADDVSQNALSMFIGAFIFSIVGLIAIENSYYGEAGRFTLFALTLGVFALVIVTFIGWVDSVARLGRLSNTIDKVEAAASRALEHRKNSPHLGGIPVGPRSVHARPVFADVVGYIQRVDVAVLQKIGESRGLRIEVAARPGTFAVPGEAIAFVTADEGAYDLSCDEKIVEAFRVATGRTYDEDPRFGLVALTEIASRALSPGINDPGTAIDVIGRHVRLFSAWAQPTAEDRAKGKAADRVSVPELSIDDMFEDAFRAIARDGAGTIEVVIRLQKAFKALSYVENDAMRKAAATHSRNALDRAEDALESSRDIEVARNIYSSIL